MHKALRAKLSRIERFKPQTNFTLSSGGQCFWSHWWVPNPPFANPGVAEKAPWRSLQSGVAGVYSLLEIPTDSYHFPSHLTPSSDPNSHFTRKALSSTPGLAPGGLGTRQSHWMAERISCQFLKGDVGVPQPLCG